MRSHFKLKIGHETFPKSPAGASTHLGRFGEHQKAYKLDRIFKFLEGHNFNNILFDI